MFASRVGYVQHIDVAAVQAWAERSDARVRVASLPGTLADPGRPLAYVRGGVGAGVVIDGGKLTEAFPVGDGRLFDDDPRFGMVVLAEIAGRALSPAVNDPGTAIDIIGTSLRLFVQWGESMQEGDEHEVRYDRVEVPEIDVRDLFDDAFTAIARDGAASVEVAVRLQKTLQSLATLGDADMRAAAEYHAQLALKRARLALSVSEDIAAVEAIAAAVPETARVAS